MVFIGTMREIHAHLFSFSEEFRCERRNKLHTNINASLAQLCQFLDRIDFWTWEKSDTFVPDCHDINLPMVAIMEVYDSSGFGDEWR